MPSKKSSLPALQFEAGDQLQTAYYQPCGCELMGKAPLPAVCPTHNPAPAPSPSETLISVILDESGSMSGVRNSTIQAYNDYLGGLRKDGGSYLITLTKFDDFVTEPTCRIQYVNQPILTAPNLTEDTYAPRGGTPLYDAIGTTIAELDPEVKGRPVIVIILTDGAENASKAYNAAQVRSMIEKRTGRGWTFVYLGANQNAWAEGSKFGMSQSNTYSFSTSNIADTMNNLSVATMRYCRSYLVADSGARSTMTSNFSTVTGLKDVDAAPSIAFVDPAAAALGSKGGKVAASRLTPEQRKERARNAGLAKAKNKS